MISCFIGITFFSVMGLKPVANSA